MSKKILFIFHEDSQSGAPNALLTFLNYVKEKHRTAFIIDILVLDSKGGLENELKKTARNFYKKQRKKTFTGKFLKNFQPNISFLQFKNKYDVIYGNTILTLKLLSKIKQKYKKVKTIIHVHESQYLCNLFLDSKTAIGQFRNIDKVLTVAQFSADNLINNYGVNAEKISIIYPTVQKETVLKNNPLANIYKKLDLLLVNIGHPHLTKGTDFIPQIGNLLRKRNLNIKFKILIVGTQSYNDYIKAIELDIQKLNLKNYIELIPHTSHPLNYLEIADAYIIPSREDSFSLMGLHAAILEKPIITFKNAIGLTEILNEECTFQADYVDIPDFVGQIEQMYNQPQLSKQKTTLAKKKYEDLFDSEKINEKHFIELTRFIQQ